MHTVKINQRNALPPPFPNQQDVVRADIQVQAAGLMEGFQYIQGASHPAHMDSQRDSGLTLPAKFLLQAPAAREAQHSV